MHIDLNITRKKLVSDLQHKYVGRHTQKSTFSTKSAEKYKEKVFINGECLHATIKDAAKCILCTTVKPKNIIHMNRDLGFCYECPKHIIPD